MNSLILMNEFVCVENFVQMGSHKVHFANKIEEAVPVRLIKAVELRALAPAFDKFPHVCDERRNFLRILDEKTIETIPVIGVVNGLNISLEHVSAVVLEASFEHLLGLG